jgi:hypothetical protein
VSPSAARDLLARFLPVSDQYGVVLGLHAMGPSMSGPPSSTRWWLPTPHPSTLKVR